MRNVIVAAFLGLGAGCLPGFHSAAVAQQRKGNNDIVGAAWDFEAKESGRKTAKVIEKGRFRATLDGKLFSPKGNQIGTYAYTDKSENEVKLTITQGKLKGKISMVKTAYKPPTWVGKWTLEDGTMAHLVIHMIKD